MRRGPAWALVMFLSTIITAAVVLLVAIPPIVAEDTLREQLGYALSKIQQSHNSIRAHLDLIGDGHALYGPDIPKLSLLVEYQSGRSILQSINATLYR